MDVQGLTGSQAKPDATANSPAPPADGGSAALDGASGASLRPEWVPEDHWDPEAGSLKLDSFGQHYSELAEFKKAQDERLAGLPQKPEDYQIDLSPDEVKELASRYEVPPDAQVYAADDPRLRKLREWAAEKKLPPGDVKELVWVGLEHDLATAKAQLDAIRAEEKKLGPNYATRIGALASGLSTVADPDRVKGLISRLRSADDFFVLEAIQKKLSSQGAAAPGAAPHTPEKKDIPWEQKMWPKRFATAKAG